MKTGLLAIVCLLSASSLSGADGWGHLKGRFVYEGDPPRAAAPPVPGRPIDQSLVIDPDSRGVANVVVWLRTENVDTHPDFAAPAASDVNWQWRNGQLDPHVMPLRVGQQLVVKNNGEAGHMLQVDTIRNPMQVLGIAATESKTFIFANPETLPIRVGCVHPWERAWLVIRDNPYVAVTAGDGAFELRNLPASNLEFQVWHERVGFLKAKPEWIKGRVKIKIAADEMTDLGTVRLSPAMLK